MIIKPLKCLKNGIKDSLDFPRDFGVIAGTDNNLAAGKVFLSSAADGRVEANSTRLPGMKAYLELPFGHRQIHWREQTVKNVTSFLEYGSFSADSQVI